MRTILEAACLTVLRLSLAAWTGAAALFVITSVAEQTAPEFGSLIRDQLAAIRFPLYYQFGFAVLGTALIAGGLAGYLSRGCQRKRVLAAVLLTGLSLAGAAADYVWVYRPLQALITPPGRARDQQFILLHQRSRQANEVHISLAVLAAVIACLPARSRTAGITGDSCETATAHPDS